LKNLNIYKKNNCTSKITIGVLIFIIIIILSYIFIHYPKIALGIFYLLFILIISAFIIKKEPYFLIKFLIIWLPIQSFILTLIWQYLKLPIPYMRGLISLKSIIVFIALIFFILKKKIKYFTVVDKIALIYFCLCSFYLAIPKFILPTRLGFIASLTSYRALIAPILLYSIGRFTPITNIEFRKLFKILLSMALLIASFGLLEYFMLPISFWNQEVDMVGYKVYVQGSGADEQSVGRLSLTRWQSGKKDRRLKSFFTHPNGVSYYYAFIIPFLIVLLTEKKGGNLKKHRKRYFLMIFLFFIVQFLSLGRGGVFATLVALSFLLFYRRKFYFALFPIFVLLLLIVGPSITQRMITTTEEKAELLLSLRVITGLETFVNNPLGFGLGHGGPWGRTFSGGKEYINIGESGYFQIGIKIGIAGILIFLAFLGSIISYTLKNAKLLKPGLERSLVQAVGLSTLGFAFSEVVSNIFFGFTIIGTFCIFSGIAVQFICNKKRKLFNQIISHRSA